MGDREKSFLGVIIDDYVVRPCHLCIKVLA